MKGKPFFHQAPDDALDSIKLGREQIARGEGINFEEASRRLNATTLREGKWVLSPRLRRSPTLRHRAANRNEER